MIQAQKDTNSKEQKTEDKAVTNTSTSRTVATAAVRAVHVDPRRSAYVTNALGAPATVILSEGNSLPETGSYQYHRVALGAQLQHVVTPVQVAGGNVSESSLPVTSRCVATSSQDLAHILVAVTTNSTLHSLERQAATVSVSAPQQSQTIGNIANVVTSNQRTSSGTISVPQTSLPQRIVLNSNMPGDVFVRLSPSAGSGVASPQFMVLDSSSLVQSSDVTKVHSYSLASAAVSALSSGGGMQKVVISTPGQHLQSGGLSHKAILTTTAHNQVRTATKRTLSSASSVRPDISFSVNNVIDVASCMSTVNKLLSGLIACEGKIPSIPSSPKQKKIKLDKTHISRDISKRKKIIDHFTRKVRMLQFKYYNQQAEYFFLKNSGNIMDHILWKKKFPPELVEYLRANKFDPYDDAKTIMDCLTKWFSGVTSAGFPGESIQSSKSSVSSHHQSPSHPSSSTSNHSVEYSGTLVKNSRPTIASQKLLSKQNSISSVYDLQIGSQEEIVERAKQEAYVMQRVGDLRREGLWSLKRLPKVAEQPRIKAHWDYLLEEMAWLATDFAQERKWKKAAAKKCARMITKHFQEKEIKAEKAEKEEQMRLRKIASMMAREIKQFWNNIEKLVEYKQQTWLEEKRKKVLDTHLNFIVDQTEKYSSWLTQGMNRNVNESPESSIPSSPQPYSISSKEKLESSDFEPEKSEESDDEETIQKEEEDVDEAERNEEIKLLKKESEMSFEDFLESLPPEILNSSTSDSNITQRLDADNEADICDLEDDDFEASGEEEDDEETIVEQEMNEAEIDYKEEIKELEADNELSVEELRKKYAVTEIPEEQDDSYEEEDIEATSDEQNDEDERTTDSFPLENKNENPSKEISDIAAAAESFQPKGNTLSTTQVFTKVPFLLKHTLREYQHIGLDWLNAMYDKKLNGILADEMGLGKTIQTISILAHLACDKGVWGPHLIVVPTSVMLNWEMEFKKWCPAFKILTYYGTPKERKQKRVGWTKPNAFHVCITSYKLVVQDHQSFRRKKWKYLILDEAQHIKNFKSQRWQMLLNFQSSHRLLLTGTPLQNNLMELWSLMHFLMPNVFQSHKEFKEWFVNPVTGMIEGSHEYNESLIKRLHKVLRPFLLRRLKSEVEKQLPKKYEHVIMCRLSKRQRYLYDDFMSQTKTKETLATGNFLSVINILMQLRKVCNHPNMFEERPTVSSFLMEGITFKTASLVHNALRYDCSKQISLYFLNLLLADIEIILTAYAAHRVKKFQTPPKMIVELDSWPVPPPQCPSVKLKVNFCNSQPSDKSSPSRIAPNPVRPAAPSRLLNSAPSGPSPRLMVIPGQQTNVARTINPVSALNQTLGVQGEQQYTLQLVQPGTAVASLAPLGGLTFQLQSNSTGSNRVQCIQSLIGGIGRMVQSSTGTQWLITSVGNSVPDQQQVQTTITTTVPALSSVPSTSTTTSIQPVVIGTNIATATVMPQVNKTGNAISPSFISSFNRPPVNNNAPGSSSTNSQMTHNKPIGRVAPLNVIPPMCSTSGVANNMNHVQPVKSPVVHSLSKPATKFDSGSCDKSSSLFYLESLAERKDRSRKDCLEALARINNHRCTSCPIYGEDLVDTISFVNSSKEAVKQYRHMWGGFLNGQSPVFSNDDPLLHMHTTRALAESVKTAAQHMTEMLDVIKRFVFAVPAVSCPNIQLQVAHPAPSELNAERRNMELLDKSLSPVYAFLHPLVSNMRTQFPELRLIQYDCGKLQRLSLLLRELKDNHHRVLIFTQMTRMLDILEQFLNYHGHTYLRLDGNTKVEQRQALMERFNADQRIFCFILSTRSGGIGVNLTGADTVIFYDSDWNPTMDAQAQDRCHRIGQTRDVHIYRLISERTVEENILKKANQKRLLGDLAIEGGNFNTAFFKKNTIHELFGIELQGDNVKSIFEKVEFVKDGGENFSPSQLEQALGMAEEEMDLQAAKTAHAEAAAEFAEFDESIPLDNDSRENEEKSPAEEELDKLMEQLTPVEKYAVQFLESLQEPLSLEQLKLAEEEIEAQKKDWELGHLKALKEEEEKRLEDEDSLLFCGREASNQALYSINGDEEMPIWAPPTPPTCEDDIYIDPCLSFWYENSVMHDSRLPPIFIKKEPKRQHVDPIVSASTTTRKQKVRKDDMVNIPRSLFDRPSAAILKMRREVKLQKVKGLMVGASSMSKPVSTFTTLKQPSIVVNKPTPDTYQDKPEWLVHEDYAILQVIQDLQGIPLGLTVLMPGHTPNWDLAADAVNSVSRVYRSLRACKARYENVIMLREEGKILYDTNPKKPKKTKGIYKTKNNRPMKTSHLYQQDNNASFTSILNARHKMVMELAMKRRLSERQSTLTSSTPKGSKMAAVLAENGINYDEPLNPMQIAANRAERIAREKQKNQPAAVAQAAQAQSVVQVGEHPANQRQIQQQSTVTVTGAAASLIPHQAQAVIASLTQAQQLQLNKTTLQQGAATSVSLAKSLSNSIMVNTATGGASGTFATITKALGQGTVSAQGAVQNATITAALNNASLRNQRTAVTGTTATTMTVQEMVAAAAAAGQVRITTTAPGTSTAPAVVSVAGLATVQLTGTQRIPGTAASTVATAVANQVNTQITTQRNIAQLSQIQAIRQTALLRQREQQTLNKQQQLKRLQAQQQQVSAGQVGTAKVAVGTGAAALTVATAQQRVANAQQVTMKQSRPLTDAEMTHFVKRQAMQQQKQQLTTAQILAQAQLQQVQPQQVSITGGTATLVKTVSAPSSVTIPVSAVNMTGVNINVSLPQGKSGAVQAKTGTTTITNQQLRQFQLQQQFLQARKGNKVATNLTQLAKVSSKGTGLPSASISTPVNAVQIVQHSPAVGSSQPVKGLSTAMTVQQIQQAMKAIPQNLPVVVTATPSLPGVQHATATLRGEPGVVASSVKAQTTTLPSTTLTTSGVLKGTPAVVVGQQQTAAILQQVAASSATLSGQHAVTLAVRATTSQTQGQVQIQVQPSGHSSLVAPQSQVVSPQTRIQQLSQNASTINIASPMPVQNVAQASSILSPPATAIVQQMPADSTIQSPTHVVMHSVAITHSSPSPSPQATSVQAVIQAARQQQQAAVQQNQKASPYTMRLRNPPK